MLERHRILRAGAGLAAAVGAAGLLACQASPGRKPRPEPPPGLPASVDGDPVVTMLPLDAIPSLDEPEMVSAAEADAFLEPDEPVIGVFDGAEARAYSAWQLDRHEIVNDRIGEAPIAVTW